MMQKLDMLLTTRGEPMDTIKLVRTQTELEVEVRTLKETVQRTEEQLAAAKNEVRETILRSSSVLSRQKCYLRPHWTWTAARHRTYLCLMQWACPGCVQAAAAKAIINDEMGQTVDEAEWME